jgi:hypothetical protein
MGVLTDFFRATQGELRSTFPRWREPLAEPVRTQRLNPFTKKMAEVLEWDPTPDQPVVDRGPVGPPPASLDMKGLGQTSIASLIGILHDAPKTLQDRFYRPALIGPAEGPWLHELPLEFVERLAALDDLGLRRAAARWAQVENEDLGVVGAGQPPEEWRAVLKQMSTFARTTMAEQKRMFMWVCL